MKNKNGFTLVELIAVIVIIGLLSLIAIPSVNTYINNSRKDAFVEMAKNYISSARTALTSKTLSSKSDSTITCKVPPLGSYTIIRIENIELESHSLKSSFKRSLEPYSGESRGFVLAINVGSSNKGSGSDKIVYFFAAVDAGGNGIDQFVSEEELSRDKVKKGNATNNYKTDLMSSNPLKIIDGKYRNTGSGLSGVSPDSYLFYMECGGSY